MCKAAVTGARWKHPPTYLHLSEDRAVLCGAIPELATAIVSCRLDSRGIYYQRAVQWYGILLQVIRSIHYCCTCSSQESEGGCTKAPQ